MGSGLKHTHTHTHLASLIASDWKRSDFFFFFTDSDDSDEATTVTHLTSCETSARLLEEILVTKTPPLFNKKFSLSRNRFYNAVRHLKSFSDKNKNFQLTSLWYVRVAPKD